MDQLPKTELDCPCRTGEGVCIAVNKTCAPIPKCLELLNEKSAVPVRKVYIALESGGIWEG